MTVVAFVPDQSGRSCAIERIQQRIRMGETQSIPSQPTYSACLMPVEQQDSPHFGPIDIFRTKEPPFEYLMDFKKSFVQDNQRMERYLRLANQIRSMEHKNLAKLHHCELVEEIQVCIKHKRVHTFCSYYNFTLEEAVEKKKLQDTYFPESELVYIMGCLIEVAAYLQPYGIAFGEYRANSIFLSPEGYVKLYLLDIEQENRHISYYKTLSDRALIDQYILAPEQLEAMSNLEYDIKFDLYKAEVFSIAMVILSLITLDKSKYYYNEDKTQLKMDRIAFDLASMGKNYSQGFVNLLRWCLQASPFNRCTIDEAATTLNAQRKSMKAVTYCIRLQEDEEKKKSSLRRDLAMSVKGQHILSGLQKKLTPSPITTLTSSTSSNFKIETKTNSSRSSQAGSLKF